MLDDMADPYELLGLQRGAAAEDIRASYRKLAKLHHPDLNPDDPAAAERFKAISAANALLSDPEARGRFDRGEIDASGAEVPPERPFWRDFADQTGRQGYRRDANPAEGFDRGFDPGDLEEMLAALRRGVPMRGADVEAGLTVGFLEAANGATRRLGLPDGRTLDVAIPAGLRDGQVLRLKGQGAPGQGGGAAGDLLIEVRVAPHPVFRRVGEDVEMDLPLTLREAVLGARVTVPTLTTPVTLTVPPAAQGGMRLRLKGRGIAGGDLHAVLRPVLPAAAEPELAAFLEAWEPREPQEPRRDMLP